MSSELILIYAAIAGVILLGAVIGIWWMNREPRVERDASGVVPLFAGTPMSADDAFADGVMAGGAVRRQAPLDLHAASAASRGMTGETDIAAQGAGESVDAWAPSAAAPSAAAQSAAERRPAAPRPASAGDAWPPAAYRPPNVRSFTTGLPPRDVERKTAAKRGPLPTDRAAEFAIDAEDGAQSVAANGSDRDDITEQRRSADVAVERQLLRFGPPVEGTLQFLPGRLLVVSGQDAGREVRFVRSPGPQGTEITFGRNEGELYRHVQLRDQTVSRMHAMLRFADGRWHLRNLSQTNPVMLDGMAVASGTEHALEDGARIEMGEVLFSFRNR